MTIEGATSADLFTIFIEQVLVPTFEPGNYYILDNLYVHSTKRGLDAISYPGATPMYLAPNRPELNPLDTGWAKLGQILRGA